MTFEQTAADIIDKAITARETDRTLVVQHDGFSITVLPLKAYLDLADDRLYDRPREVVVTLNEEGTTFLRFPEGSPAPEVAVV